jgi:hypothetical protein
MSYGSYGVWELTTPPTIFTNTVAKVASAAMLLHPLPLQMLEVWIRTWFWDWRWHPREFCWVMPSFQQIQLDPSSNLVHHNSTIDPSPLWRFSARSFNGIRPFTGVRPAQALHHMRSPLRYLLCPPPCTSPSSANCCALAAN